MLLFLANLLLAVVWCLSFGPFNPGNFIVGLILGYVVLRMLIPKGSGPRRYFEKIETTISFCIYFMVELVKANLTMAVYTLSPLGKLRPAILAVPLQEGMTDIEIMSLANMITLTPGTLSMDVSHDRKTLFVHYMHVENREAAVNEIVNGFEKRLLHLTR